MKRSGLDVHLCCLPVRSKWRETHGGQLYYADEGEEEPLQVGECGGASVHVCVMRIAGL